MNLTYVVVATDVMSIFIDLVLLYGNIFESHRKTEYGKMFSWIVFTNIIALIGDALAWGLEELHGYDVMLYLTNTISIVAALVLIAQFLLYISTYLGERVVISKKLVRAILIVCSVVIAFTLVACLTGKMFTIRDGVYESLPLYDSYSLMSAGVLLATLAVVLKYRKELGTHDSIAAYIYIILPFASAIINVVEEDLCFTYQAVTLSTLILYIMIQSEQSVKLLEEKRISIYYANHDALTGLFSRRIYTEKLEKIAGSKENVGVVFADLNGLKYMNDNFGHKEGDRLIIQFANMLTEYFRVDDVCRISGDEFVVLADKIKEEEFNMRVRKLEDAILDGAHQIACVGTKYGAGETVEELVRQAETLMYARKAIYHKQHPELRRGRPLPESGKFVTE